MILTIALNKTVICIKIMTDKEDVDNKPENVPIDDEALEKLAVEELIREAVQGAARAEIVGPSGWVKAPPQKTNKRFLVNTIRNAVGSNKYHFKSHRRSHKSPTRERRSESSIHKDKSKRKR